MLLLMLLLLLHHDASLQPTRDGPPPMDAQNVSATAYRVRCGRVGVMKAEHSRSAPGDATGAAVDRLCFCARMVCKRALGCA